MRGVLLAAITGVWTVSSWAGSSETLPGVAARFINQLPPEQREDLLKKAREAISLLREKRERKEAALRKDASRMSLNLVKELYKKGESAYEDGNFPVSYSYFRVVAFSGVDGTEQLRAKAQERLAEIEAEAIARYDEADVRFRQGDYVASALLLDEVKQLFPYTSVADRARKMLRRLVAKPEAAAAVLYAEGKRHEDAEDYVKAVEIYEKVVRKYPTQLDGMRARIRLDRLRSDPEVLEVLKRAREFEACSKAPQLLNLGRNYLLNDQQDRAREKLSELVSRFPDSPEAGEARDLLRAMDGGENPASR